MRQWIKDFSMAVLALLGVVLVLAFFMFLAAVAMDLFGLLGGGTVVVVFVAGVIATYESFGGKKGE